MACRGGCRGRSWSPKGATFGSSRRGVGVGRVRRVVDFTPLGVREGGVRHGQSTIRDRVDGGSGRGQVRENRVRWRFRVDLCTLPKTDWGRVGALCHKISPEDFPFIPG